MVQSEEEDPFTLFESWLSEAYLHEESDPNAMIVSTVNPEGGASVRTVLLKQWSRQDGFIFCTNKKSRKAQHMALNNHIATLFYWKSTYRQVNMEGVVTPTDRKTSEHFFSLRPRESQLISYVSQQSQPLESNASFQNAIERARDIFGSEPIPCPEHWGGYQFTPQRIEFWIGHPYRLHNRTLYHKESTHNRWSKTLLYP